MNSSWVLRALAFIIGVMIAWLIGLHLGRAARLREARKLEAIDQELAFRETQARAMIALHIEALEHLVASRMSQSNNKLERLIEDAEKSRQEFIQARKDRNDYDA